MTLYSRPQNREIGKCDEYDVDNVRLYDVHLIIELYRYKHGLETVSNNYIRSNFLLAKKQVLTVSFPAIGLCKQSEKKFGSTLENDASFTVSERIGLLSSQASSPTG